jgi:hypothetical protein
MAVLMRRWLLGLGLLVLGGTTGLACFAPRQPACAFSCADEPHLCPSGYSCADDGFCHRDQGTGVCTLLADAGRDGDASLE